MTKEILEKTINYTMDRQTKFLKPESIRERICDIGATIEYLQAVKWWYHSILLGKEWNENNNPDLMIVEKLEIKHREEMEKALIEAMEIFRGNQ